MGAECSTLAKTKLLQEEVQLVQPSEHQNSGEVSRCDGHGDLSSGSTRSDPDLREGSSGQISFASVSSHLGKRLMLVDPNEIVFKRELCSTCKSTISIASWKGNMVAAKQLKVDPEEDEESKSIKMKDLMTETEIFSKISHPCLVKFLGANLHAAEPLLLTELMENQDVETYMLKQRISSVDGAYKPRFSLAMRWALDTGNALAYLHGLSHPIIHRDLKPLNMFLTRNLEVKIGDFGLAKVMPTRGSDRAPKMSGGVGTWRYMAPEVVRYEQYDEKIDIYAFSLIMYFIFSGRQPFYTLEEDPDAVLRAYSRGEEPRPTLHSSVGNRELRDLLPRMWHQEASRRPSAQECVDVLSVMGKPEWRKSWSDIRMKFKMTSAGAILKCVPKALEKAGMPCHEPRWTRGNQVVPSRDTA